MRVRIDRANLAAWMARANLNGLQLAERAGLSRGTITAVRSGKSCSMQTAGKLADALGVQLESLLEPATGIGASVFGGDN